MNNKEHLFYQRFFDRLSRTEKNMAYALIGWCLEEKKPHPILTNEWKPGPDDILFPYLGFSDEQKNTLSRFIRVVMKREGIDINKVTYKSEFEDDWGCTTYSLSTRQFQ